MANTKVTGELIADNAIKAVHIDETATGITLADLSVTGGLTVDTNTLVVDAANNRVGVGGSPNDALEVAGNTASAHRIRINNANASGVETLIFTQGSTIKSWIEYNNSTSNLDIWQYTPNDIRFGTNNGEKMRIDSSGNVGIGTSSPHQKLTVDGLSYLGGDSSESAVVIGTLSSVPFIQGYDPSGTNNTLAFYTGVSERMRITSSGTTHIKATKAYGSQTATLRVQTIPTGTNFADGSFQNIVFGDETIVNGYLGQIAIVQENASASTASTMRFYTNSGGGNGGTSERMRITRDGGLIINATESYHVSNPSHLCVAGSGTYYISPSNNNVSQITVENRNTAAANGHAILLLRTNVNGSTVSGPNAGNSFISFDAYNYAGWTAGVDYADNRNFKITTGWDDVNGIGVELSYTGTSWQSNSDERLKENVVEIDTVLDKIDDIRCVKYNFISDVENMPTQYGFIAQDWQENFSEVLSVSNSKNSNIENKLSMKYTETIPILMKAIKELKAEMELLKSRQNG